MLPANWKEGYRPMCEIVADKKKIRKKKELKLLKLNPGPPLHGLLPAGVEQELAEEFIKAFVPSLGKLKMGALQGHGRAA